MIRKSSFHPEKAMLIFIKKNTTIQHITLKQGLDERMYAPISGKSYGRLTLDSLIKVLSVIKC